MALLPLLLEALGLGCMSAVPKETDHLAKARELLDCNCGRQGRQPSGRCRCHDFASALESAERNGERRGLERAAKHVLETVSNDYVRQRLAEHLKSLAASPPPTESATCGYDRPWQSPCPNPRPCTEHANKRCWCGATATRGCDFESGFVCGNPTCAEHECNWVGQGVFSAKGQPHSERGTVQFAAWKAARSQAIEAPPTEPAAARDVLRAAIDEALSDLECAALRCWAFTRAAMTKTHGECKCDNCRCWRLLAKALDTTPESEGERG